MTNESGRLITEQDLENWFTYHAPTGSQNAKYEKIRLRARALATEILESTPGGPDQTAAIRKLRETVMTANQAIACAPLTSVGSAG